MLEQTAEQKAQFSLDIDYILNHLVNDTVSFYIRKYGKTFDRRLGLTEDDLMNDVREQIWKGLLTYKPDGSANLRTYLNTIIKNRFLVLLDRSTLTKYNSINYYADVFSSASIDRQYIETEETGETLLERREEFMRDLVLLSETDRIIYNDLLLGFSLNEMVRRNKLPLAEVIGAINRIDATIKARKNSE